MNEPQTKKQIRETHWRQVIEACQASGLGVKAYCKQENICSSYIYAWRKRLAIKDAPPATSAPAFIELQAKQNQPVLGQAALVIETSTGSKVLLSQLPPVAYLAALIQGL